MTGSFKFWNGTTWEPVRGEKGEGVPIGGAPGQVVTKASATDYDATWHTLTAADVSDFESAVDANPTIATHAAAIARVDPGTTGNVGQALRRGPNAPAWGERVISADWYSNPNDAIAAAGIGGEVRFSGGVTYILTEPLRPMRRQTLFGVDPRTTIIKYASAGASVVEVSDPATEHDYVTLRNMLIDGDFVSAIALDARGMTRALFENVKLQNITQAGLSLGGDMPAFQSGWSNVFRKGEIIAPANGAGVLIDGHTDSGTGARTGNNHTLQDLIINLTPDATSIGVDIVAGDSNRIVNSDIGYSEGIGIAIRMQAGAEQNFVHQNRVENCPRGVVIDGGFGNIVSANWFSGAHATYHPAEVYTGNLGSMRNVPNQFLGNTYDAAALSPYVWEETDLGTVILDNQGLDLNIPAGQPALRVFNRQNSLNWAVDGNGTITWIEPTGAGYARPGLRIDSTTTGYMSWADGMLIRQPTLASLPAAAASRAGAIVRIAGAAGVADGIYVCCKKADGAYEWRNLTP